MSKLKMMKALTFLLVVITLVCVNVSLSLRDGHLVQFGSTAYAMTSPVTVASPACDISGNGGRKLVSLSNGWLVSGMWDSVSGNLKYMISKDNGQNWSQLTYSGFSVGDTVYFALANYNTTVYALVYDSHYSAYMLFYRFDATTVTNTSQSGISNPDSGQTAIGPGCSLAVDSTGVIHATWCSKNSTYPSNFNMRYSKSTDAGATWAIPRQMTSMNYSTPPYRDNTNPCIVLNNNLPVIFTQYEDTNGAHEIDCCRFDGTLWRWNAVYGGNDALMGSYPNRQYNPCAVVDSAGNIHVVWQGQDTNDTKFNIRYSKSMDGGATWSTAIKLTSGNSYDQINPSISTSYNSKLYVLWSGIDPAISTTSSNIRKIVYSLGTWSSISTITKNTTNNAQDPSTCSNYSLYTDPLFLYSDSQANAIKYIGALSDVPYYYATHKFYYSKYTVTATSNVDSAGTYIEYLQAPEGYYPGNGKYVDGYWYIKGSFVDVLPTVNVVSPISNSAFGEGDTTISPTISVKDEDNDILTCKYYIDSNTIPNDTKILSNATSAQTVTFNAIDMSSLSEGSHNIRFEVSDGISTSVVSPVIIVDKSAPTLGTVSVTSSYNSIKVSGSAIDSYAGLDSYPYRYTVGANVSSWLSSTIFTQDSLLPNTQNNVKFEVRDAKGHIATYSKSVYTKAQIPALTLNNPQPNSVDITTNDMNPATTQYQIMIGSNYVSSTGALVPQPSWVTLTNKKITVSGIQNSSAYSFTAKAKNDAGEETDFCPAACSITTDLAPGVPSTITSVAAYNSIAVSWRAVAEAEGYDIKIDNSSIIDNGLSLTYNNTGLVSGTSHTYSIGARNNGGEVWSSPIAVSTLTTPDVVQTANTSNSYAINCTNGEEFNLSFSASDVFDFNTPSFTVIYKPNDVDVTDLCGYTPDAELTTGVIQGTDINVTTFDPVAGTIVFKINKPIPAGQSFSGIINSIGFKAKVSGQTSITYSMH